MAYPHKWSPTATGRAQDSESSPAKDRRYTDGPHNQPDYSEYYHVHGFTDKIACTDRSDHGLERAETVPFFVLVEIGR